MNNSRYTSPDIESFVVSYLLSNPKKIINYIDLIRLESFSDPRLVEVVKAIKTISVSNPEPEVNLIVEELAKNQKLEKIGGKSFIIWLYNNNFSLPSEIKQHLEIIAEKQKLRELKKIVLESTQNLDKSNQNAATISNELIEKISALESSHQVQTFSSIHEIATEVFQFLTELRTSPSAIKGVSTGYDSLDVVTSGFQKGDLIVLAARPSVGKTAFALNLAWNVCKSQKSVLFFSLEMSKNDLGMRLLSLVSGIPGNKFKRPKNLSPEDLQRIQLSISKRLKNIKLTINDSGSINIDEIVNEVIKRHRNNEVFDLIVIDYLQLINSQTKSQYYNRTVEVSMISRKLKQLARAVNTPIIALAQLSRNVERREDKIPMLSDLRESGAIEQDADIVLFLHRDDYYNKKEGSVESSEPNTNLIIAKHRNGAVGKLLFHFLPEVGSFIEAIDTKAS
ncbi:replicative DNA helicase [Mesomycoplasma ovipneumoniae]|uniref:replicative DNA helicase n=1 Tax=Mesomycoplasma ovipneumoniae TaxID=29562 RepID=UPI00296408E9|nr:replicative DNA helicase [Mesomycoplasma ovipneumoniae]MDW2891218.1 replicative DNA helicase [Mesomycoplasma ovipneumoniae]